MRQSPRSSGGDGGAYSAHAELLARVTACRRCERLVAYREEIARTKKRAYLNDEYWARAVPSLGDPLSRIALVGLAPAAHGANRTGRMFTGDGTDSMGAGSFLMRALHAVGFANQPFSTHADDGLQLHDLYVTASVRCAPPLNKPLPEEIDSCRAWMLEELPLLPNLRVIVALGSLAFNETLKNLAHLGATIPRPRPRFAHGAEVHLGKSFPVVIGSYHPSRQNTQTGKLTPEMLERVLRRAREVGTAMIET